MSRISDRDDARRAREAEAARRRDEQEQQRRDEVGALTTIAGAADALRRQAIADRRARVIAEIEASHPPLHRLFGGERGAVAILRSIPGFAGLWDAVVPAGRVLCTTDREGVRWDVVSCSCGGHVALMSGNLGDCVCGRWFFHVGTSIRWRAFADEPVAA